MVGVSELAQETDSPELKTGSSLVHICIPRYQQANTTPVKQFEHLRQNRFLTCKFVPPNNMSVTSHRQSTELYTTSSTAEEEGYGRARNRTTLADWLEIAGQSDHYF
ncbi:hypothetical protein CBL_00071 [Carabus blaptoides fortunei]